MRRAARRTGHVVHEPASEPPALQVESPLPRRRLCGAMAVHHRLLELDHRFRARQHQIECATERLATAGRGGARAGLVTVPVVVHVVYHTQAQNVSDAQVQSQIAALNRDYRARNADRERVPEAWRSLVADARIDFALAARDPRGRPAAGITRTETSRQSFADDDAVKSAATGGADPWPTSRYLNIWVCNLTPWLGYAQFPGGPKRTDGVVILYRAFGTVGAVEAPFDLGRTATHEVGHWLNLRHIWGDTEDCSGGDFVDDTPNAATPNFGRPKFPHVSCGNGPLGDMFMNYMDYVDDAAMHLFTRQQVARMHAVLAGPRRAVGGRGRRRGTGRRASRTRR